MGWAQHCDHWWSATHGYHVENCCILQCAPLVATHVWPHNGNHTLVQHGQYRLQKHMGFMWVPCGFFERQNTWVPRGKLLHTPACPISGSARVMWPMRGTHVGHSWGPWNFAIWARVLKWYGLHSGYRSHVIKLKSLPIIRFFIVSPYCPHILQMVVWTKSWLSQTAFEHPCCDPRCVLPQSLALPYPVHPVILQPSYPAPQNLGCTPALLTANAAATTEESSKAPREQWEDGADKPQILRGHEMLPENNGTD